MGAPHTPRPQSEAVTGGREANTTREWVIYRQGGTIQLTTAMEDVMGTVGCAMVLPVCKQPMNDLPSNTRLHRRLVSWLVILLQVEPSIACVHPALTMVWQPV